MRRALMVIAVGSAIPASAPAFDDTNGRSASKELAAEALPSALRRAAIAAHIGRSGQIAGARIANTDTWIVYIEAADSCGSGGCRAQVWTGAGDRFVRSGHVPLGRLPIVVLPRSAMGMPVLGVTIFDKNRVGSALMPVAFDGKGYIEQADARLLPADAGRPLLTYEMLRPF